MFFYPNTHNSVVFAILMMLMQREEETEGAKPLKTYIFVGDQFTAHAKQCGSNMHNKIRPSAFVSINVLPIISSGGISTILQSDFL